MSTDVEALALEAYPEIRQDAERAAFIRGFLAADPAKALKDPGRVRRKFGERTGVFRSLDVGDRTEVLLTDSRNWQLWRVTATYLTRTYGCLFTVRRDRQDRTKLIITRLR